MSPIVKALATSISVAFDETRNPAKSKAVTHGYSYPKEGARNLQVIGSPMELKTAFLSERRATADSPLKREEEEDAEDEDEEVPARFERAFLFW